MIFLNAEEKTSLCTASLEAMGPFQSFYVADASLSETVALQKKALYELVGASLEATFMLTGSAEEASQQVLWAAFFEKMRLEGRTHFITSCLEEAPVLRTFKRFEDMGACVKIVRANRKGEIDLSHLEELLSPRTALVSFSLAAPLTGVLQPVEGICSFVRKFPQAFLHLDAKRAVGKMALSFQDWDLDFLSFGGELLHAGAGCGALFSKKGRVPPLVERPFDAASFFSLCAAAKQANLLLDRFSLETALFRQFFEEEVMRKIPGAYPLFSDSSRLPHTTVLVLPDLHQETVLYRLSQKKVFASMGGGALPSLKALLISSGVKEDVAERAVSFSFTRLTTQQDMERAITALEEVFHG